jgi:penicillin-binding protein 1C
MARVLNHYTDYSGHYDPGDFCMPTYIAHPQKTPTDKFSLPEEGIMSAAAIWQTFHAMEEVMRPGEELLWSQFSSTQRIAWKTGTSFGFRDGWAIGVTPRQVVVVWIGNADGEGRPGLIGISTAAPIMFEIFRLLPQSGWFDQPFDEMMEIPVCKLSGFRAGELCDADSQYVFKRGLRTASCPYHQLVHLDLSRSYQVNSECESPSRMIHEPWFILPPSMEFYYKAKHAGYRALPRFRNNCSPLVASAQMEMIYPRRSNRLYVPVELDGQSGKAVFEAAHRNRSATIHWHLDQTFIGSTQSFHQMALDPSPGRHQLTLVDDGGERMEIKFEILGSN